VYSIFNNTPPIAVVPIFVNAGTALLPAILAPIASALALLLKPRELARLARRRPLLLPSIAVGGVALTFLCIWLFSPTTPAKAQGPQRIDWAKVALDILRQEENGTPTTNPTTQPATVRNEPTVFRYDYARCGHDGSPSPLDLRPRWEFNPEEDTMYLSSPAVVGDRVYGASATLVLTSPDKYLGSIFCVSASDGAQIWKIDKLDNQDHKAFFSSPAITADGKYLLIGQGLHDHKDSYLICLDAATGRLHWKLQTPLHIESSPAIHGDMVVAGVGAIEGPDHKPIGDPGFVLAVRISDGKELWRYPVADPESSPAISKDGTIYIGSGFQGNAVVALRSETDAELKAKNLPREIWKQTFGYPGTGAVTLIDDLVIVGGGNSDFVNVAAHPGGVVAAFDSKTGDQRWKLGFTDSVLGAIAARDGKVLCPVRNGELVLVNQKDASIIWRKSLGTTSNLLGAPAMTSSHIYAVTKDGYLIVVSVKDGSVIEKKLLNKEDKPAEMGLTLSSPMISNSRVFVGSETGGLRCFVGGKVAQLP
jgi:outer membrane protein assembly factor BamB